MSRSSMRVTSKKNFIDPSIALCSLGINHEKLLKEPNIFGHMFESMCIRDLKVYALKLDGEISFYRDRNGLECDAVLHIEDGRYALIEIKLSGGFVTDGINNLNAIEQKIIDYNADPKNKRKMELPTFKIVITTEETGY